MSKAKLVLGALVLGGCSAGSPPEDEIGPSRYAYVWAGDADEQDTDFIAVFDMSERSPTYGQVITTKTVGVTGMMAHHTELSLSSHGLFFANGFSGDRTFVFDLSSPREPKLVRELDPIPGYDHVHSFWRHPDGRVFATLQYGDSTDPGRPGGLAEFTAAGDLVRTTSSADPAFPGARIRTYALDGYPETDVLVTTSSPMDDEVTENVVQVWRLSELSLRHTVALPPSADSAHQYPFEVRILPGGERAFLNTYMCGLYLLDGITGDEPTIDQVMVLGSPRADGCGVPVIVGSYWIMPVEFGPFISVLDISDPRVPTEVFRLDTEEDYYPHWVTSDPGSNRLIFSDEVEGAGLRIAKIDLQTGELRWDETFTYADGQPGIPFDRESWPHGDTGPAKPHGVVFGH